MKSSCCNAVVICSECGGRYVWAPTLNDEELEKLKFIWIKLTQMLKGKTLKASQVHDAIHEFNDGEKFMRYDAALRAQEIISKDPTGPVSGPGCRYFVRAFPGDRP